MPDGVQFPVPGHGIAVVAAVGPNGLPDAPARLSAESDEWILTVAGRSIAMTPIGLDRADVDAVLAILHDAEQPLIWMDDVPSEFSASLSIQISGCSASCRMASTGIHVGTVEPDRRHGDRSAGQGQDPLVGFGGQPGRCVGSPFGPTAATTAIPWPGTGNCTPSACSAPS